MNSAPNPRPTMAILILLKFMVDGTRAECPPTTRRKQSRARAEYTVQEKDCQRKTLAVRDDSVTTGRTRWSRFLYPTLYSSIRARATGGYRHALTKADQPIRVTIRSPE